jgi:hypothetical protein
MRFIDSSGNYPRFIGDLMLSHPEWKEGTEIPEGWIVVEESDLPEEKVGHTVVESAPEAVGNVVYRKWYLKEVDQDDVDRGIETIAMIEDLNRNRLL